MMTCFRFIPPDERVGAVVATRVERADAAETAGLLLVIIDALGTDAAAGVGDA
jgi:hypothetical protein